MEVVRTPEHRFARLSGYPYPAQSLALDEDGELRLAYVAEGAHENRAVLLLHGPPTWSYVWRRVIPMLVEGGCRVVAPDLVGFGRSDKPVRVRDHRLERHVGWVTALVDVLDLREAAVVAHGAAGLLALRLLAAEGATSRFTSLIAVCPLFAGGAPPGDDRTVGELVAGGCTGALSPIARAGYDAPFPEAEQRAGLRAQAAFIAGPGGETRDAEVAGKLAGLPLLELPILAVAGERDAMAATGWLEHLPGPAANRRNVTIAGAGHYVPEDRGPELALAVLSFLR